MIAQNFIVRWGVFRCATTSTRTSTRTRDDRTIKRAQGRILLSLNIFSYLYEKLAKFFTKICIALVGRNGIKFRIYKQWNSLEGLKIYYGFVISNNPARPIILWYNFYLIIILKRKFFFSAFNRKQIRAFFTLLMFAFSQLWINRCLRMLKSTT